MRFAIPIAALFVALSANAKVVGVLEGEDVTISLTNEPCQITELISNLKLRATWDEAGKTIEGCWGTRAGIVVSYWADRTVAMFPAEYFQPPQEVMQ